MSNQNVKRPRITCPADLTSVIRALWRNPANSHFLAKLERGEFSNIPVQTIEEAVDSAHRSVDASARGASGSFSLRRA